MGGDHGERHISAVIKQYMGDVHERYKAGGVDLIGRSTGFKKIDEFTGGMQSDELWIVGSRAGMGKSSFVLDLSMNMQEREKEVLIFSLEMSGEMLINRMLSSISGVSAGKILRGKFDDKREWEAVTDAAVKLREYNIHIFDRSVTSDQILEIVTARGNIGLTIVDYAAILTDTNVHGEVERLTRISSNMKALTRPDYSNAPVALVVQINKQSEMNDDSRPMLSNIKGSDSFAADANVVLFPFRPYYFNLMKGDPPKDVEDAEIIIAKNRNGPVMTTKAKFYPRLMKWEQ